MRDKTVSSRSAILAAAFDVFSHNPGASLSDVADAAGVGRATLHRHFAGRNDLMVALTLAASEELDAAVEAAVADCETYTDALRVALRAMLPLASRHMFLATEAAQRDPRVTEANARQTRDLAADIEAARAEGLFAEDLPTAWIIEVYENLLYAGWAMVVAGEATPNQAADLAWRTFTDGLKP